MKPTDRALALIDPVRIVLRDVERLLCAPEDFDPDKSQRRFVIAATDYMEVLVLPALVELITRQAPNVVIHVKRTELPFPESELEHNELDVVLGFETILKCQDGDSSVGKLVQGLANRQYLLSQPATSGIVFP